MNFKIEVRDKDGTCVLYQEFHHAQDLSLTRGGFSLMLGTGSTPTNFIAGGSALNAQVFMNPGVVAPFTGCGSGLTLNSGDERSIRIYYDLGSGLTAMSPDVPVVGSAYAMIAETLQGKDASQFLQLPGTGMSQLTQANAEYAFSLTNWQRLKDLIDGVSSSYLPTAGTGKFDFGNRVITGVSTPGTASDAVNKGYADAFIGGRGADLTGVGPGFGGGQALVWDQTQNKWVAGSATDATKLPLSGGTMSGNINMNGNDLLSVGGIVQGLQTTLTLGRYTDAQEATLLGSLGTSAAGMSWYNVDDKSFKIWNGTSASEQVYLSSGGKISSAWFPDTGVASGNYGGPNSIPVFTVGADGRITAAYGTAISGVTPGGAAGGDLTGTYPNPLITSNAVTTTKIADNAITAAKIKSTGVAINRLVATDPVTPNTLVYFECAAPDEIMRWTASGWGCTTVAALAPVKTVAGKTPDAAGNVALNAADIAGLGNAATKNYGTAANQLVELDGTGRIPASLLPSGSGTITQITAVAPLQGGGLSGNVTVSIDVGTGANQVLQLNASAQIPSVDGSLLTNVNATRLATRPLSLTGPGTGQVLMWNGSQWEPANASSTLSWPLLANPGTTAPNAPSYSFTGDTDTGMFSPAAGQIAFTQNGAISLFIDADGDIGIGTALPDQKLHVAGGIRSEGFGFLALQGADPAMPVAAPFMSAAANSGFSPDPVYSFWYQDTLGISNPAGQQMGFVTDGVERMRITDTGNVGIGTTAPGSAALEVAGTGANDSAILVPRSTTALRPAGANGMIRYNTNMNAFEFFQNGAWVNYGTGSASGGFGSQWITSGANIFYGTGSVGIGTASPSGRLHIVGESDSPQFIIQANSAQTNDLFQLRNSSGSVMTSFLPDGRLRANPGSSSLPGFGFTGDGDTGFYSPGPGTAALATNGTARLAVDAAGNVGIGTTTPASQLEIYSTAAFPAITLSRNEELAANDRVGLLDFQAKGVSVGKIDAIVTNTNEDSSNIRFYTSSGGSLNQRLAILASGTVVVGNGDTSSTPVTANIRATDRSTSSADGSGSNFNLFAGRSTGSASGGAIIFHTSGSGASGSAMNPALERMRIDGTGNIGIGTATPASALDIAGTTSANSSVIVPRAGTSARPAAINGMIRYNTDTNKFEAVENGAWIDVISAGSGTVSFPLLANPSGSAGAPAFAFNSDSDTGLFSPAANTVAISSGGTTRLQINSVGALFGSGGTFEGFNLEVNSPDKWGGNAGGVVLVGGLHGGQVSAGNNKAIFGQNLAWDPEFGMYRSVSNSQMSWSGIEASYGTIHFYANPSGGGHWNNLFNPVSRMAILPSGNVGIGTTSPGSAALDVAGTGANNSAILIPRNTTALRPAGANGMIRYNTDTNAFEFFQNGAWVNYGTGGGGGGSGDFKADGSVSMTGTFKAASGTEALPGITFASDSSSGITSYGTSGLGISTGGYSAVRIVPSSDFYRSSLRITQGGEFSSVSLGVDVANNGARNLNITTPDAVSTIPGGSLYLTSGRAGSFVGASGGSVYISGGSTNGGTSSIQGGSASVSGGDSTALGKAGDAVVRGGNNSGTGGAGNLTLAGGNASSGTDGYIALQTDNTDRMRIVATGQVGIGTATPGSAALDVVGTGANNSALLIPRSTTALRPAGANGMIRYNTNANKFEFFENGNWVNYGTGGGSSSVSWPLLASPGTAGPGAPSFSFSNDADTGLYSPGPGTAALATNGTARLSIQPNGFVGIGDSNPSEFVSIKRPNGTSIIRTEGLSAGLFAVATGGFSYVALWDSNAPADKRNKVMYSEAGDLVFGKTLDSWPDEIPQMTIADSGNVGIGTSSPRAKLDVNGAMVGAPAISGTAGPFDFAAGNVMYTTNSCGAFTFNNMKDGGSYTFIVKGVTSATCSFTMYSGSGTTGPLTVHLPPDHGATTASKHTVYTFIVAGSDVYVSWIPGF